jgi:hypothetical protein
MPAVAVAVAGKWKLTCSDSHREVCHPTSTLKVQSSRKDLQMIGYEARMNKLHRRSRS